MTRYFPLCVLLLSSSPAHALVAPAYQILNRYRAFFAEDSCFSVSALKEPRDGESAPTIPVEVCSEERASAWELLKRGSVSEDAELHFLYRGRPVRPAEVNGSTQVERARSIAAIVTTALRGNKAFFRAESTVCPTGGCFYPFAVTVEMEPMVIQTFVDDISERYGNQNLTAADHLAQLIDGRISGLEVTFTIRKLTSKMK